MYLRKLPIAIRRVLGKITRALIVVSCVFLCIMALVIFANVVGRFLLNQPLLGVIELVELMMVIVVFFAICYAAVRRGHVTISLIASRLQNNVRAVLRSIGFLLSFGIFALITYQSIQNTIYYVQHLERTTDLLFIPYAPFRFIMALGFLILSIIMLTDVFTPMFSEDEPGGGSTS